MIQNLVVLAGAVAWASVLTGEAADRSLPTDLRVGASAVNLKCDASMVLAGGPVPQPAYGASTEFVEGIPFLQALRSDPATAAMPIVVLSADATERQIERLLADGASAYVTKPIDVAEFLRTIDEYLPAPKPTVTPPVSR